MRVAPIGPRPDAEEKLREIAEKQGKLGKSKLENLLAVGVNLWDTPEEFEQFLELVREIRHAKG